MNYLRDLNVSIPYKMTAGAWGLAKTLYNGRDFNTNYEESLEHPSRA
jgi:hypothetical protein